MKKILIPIIILAMLVAFYEQSQDSGNMYVLVIAFVVFMYGMMRLSAKIKSKNEETNE